MKKLFFLFILITALSLSLFACGGGEDTEPCEVCVDSDKNGKCDVCGGDVELVQADLPLFIGGEPTFTIVMADNVASDVKEAVRALQNTLSRSKGIDITVATESKSTEAEVEILIGNISSRGERYLIDEHTLGTEGYVMKLVDTKVIINGGSTESLLLALEKFSEDIIGANGREDIVDVTMKAENSIEVIQTDFNITSLKIDGVDIRSFKIVADLSVKEEKNCAESLRELIYETTGVYLDVTSDASGANLIHIKKADDGKFTITASDGKLTFAYSHDNLLETLFTTFLIENIKFKRGEVSFSGELLKRDTTVVYYEDFGAAGDGKTNDFEAIYLTHLAANKGGQTVKATAGKTYYISDTTVNGSVQSATIQTNVDWTGAKFIIDDTGLTASGIGKSAIFKVTNDENAIKITNKSVLAEINADRIGPGTDKIVIPKDKINNWDGPVMAVLYNSNHKVYRRRGYGGFDGASQMELVILDKDGNVSEETPLMFDYRDLTQITVYRLDPSKAITIKGGEITTIASKKDTAYISRNLSVSRSYTTLLGVKHYVKGELELYNQVDADGNKIADGACYSAFYAVGSATDVTLKDCVMTARREFNSSYEFSASTANNVVLDGCTQSNFWVTVDENYEIHPATKDTPGAIASQGSVKVRGTGLPLFWGAGSSNYCKNLKYIDTQLSRYDAHAGVYNGEIIGCEITGIELTGWGTFTIEDTEWYSYGGGSIANSLIYLRNDYGCTFNGTIKIKNVDAYFNTTKANDSYLFYHSYANWYFGYTAAFPSVEIDNLKCYDRHTKEILDEGYEILLNSGSHITSAARLHLPESNKASNYAIVDADKDGFVDEPIMDRDLDGRLDEPCDLDGDGKVGNTSISYEEAKAAAGGNIDNGTYHQGSNTNLNIIKPPEYIKIFNNTGEGSFTLKVKNTAGSVSDGGYYDSIEKYGGFFGDTKFYYTVTNYFVGTSFVTQSVTSSFSFYD